jgi:hypothetical protein
VYGTPHSLLNDPAVIANPENRSEIFNWKLTETRDPFGNRIRYDYERDSGDTADHLWDQLYLRQIRYVDYVDPQSNDEQFLVSVTFNYEERPDPFSDYRAGFEIRTNRRCISIEVRTHADRERLVRVYRPRPSGLAATATGSNSTRFTPISSCAAGRSIQAARRAMPRPAPRSRIT